MEPLLLQLGLSKKQIHVYVTLMEAGPSTPSALAKLCSLPRPTVYAILAELHDQGFVQEDLSAQKKMFLITPPDELSSILDSFETELEKKRMVIKQLTPLLKKATQGSIPYTPRILHIPQNRIASYLKSQTEKWNSSLKQTHTEYLGFQDESHPEMFLDYIEWYWSLPSSQDIQLRIITNPSRFEKEVMNTRPDKNFAGRRSILQWEGLGQLSFTTWIIGDYVVLLNTRQRPFYLIEIYDPSFARSQRQIFEAVWSLAVIGSSGNGLPS